MHSRAQKILFVVVGNAVFSAMPWKNRKVGLLDGRKQQKNPKGGKGILWKLVVLLRFWLSRI